jgi:hypothetical protein
MKVGEKYAFHRTPQVHYEVVAVFDDTKTVRMIRVTKGGGIFASLPWNLPFSGMDLFIKVG